MAASSQRSSSAWVLDVCIPTYNSAPELPACLEALKKADLPIGRLVVVDRNSVDGTQGIIRSFFPSAVIIEDGGVLGRARTLLMRNARTDWFLFVDSDVVVSPDIFSRLESRLRSAPPEVAAICCTAPEVVETTFGRINSIMSRFITGLTLELTFIRRKHVNGIDISRYPGAEDGVLGRELVARGFAIVKLHGQAFGTHHLGIGLRQKCFHWGSGDRITGVSVVRMLTWTFRAVVGSPYFALRLREVEAISVLVKTAYWRLTGYLKASRYFDAER